MAVLEAKNLGIAFGGLRALQDVQFSIGEKEIIGLIGPNGAGKTTVFNLLTDVYVPTEGTITLENQNIVGKKTYQITQGGISRTFQNIRLFKDISVIDNVKIAMNFQMKYSVLSGIFRLPAYRREEERVDKRAHELLQVFNLDEKAEDLAKNLPYGQQRKLEIARALATNPKVLLLDEPAAGMNPQETAELTALIKQIQQQFNITILLIEHDMSLVMNVTERIYVLEYGRLIAHGTPDEIKNNKRVIEAYLGGEA